MFSTFGGDVLTNLHSKPGEKGKHSTGEHNKKSSGDGAPKLQISVPCRGRTCAETLLFQFLLMLLSGLALAISSLNIYNALKPQQAIGKKGETSKSLNEFFWKSGAVLDIAK